MVMKDTQNENQFIALELPDRILGQYFASRFVIHLTGKLTHSNGIVRPDDVSSFVGMVFAHRQS